MTGSDNLLPEAAALAKADASRIEELINDFATLSDPASGPGVTRLGFTSLERAAHKSFADRLSSLGLSVRTDTAGNTTAELVGTQPALPALGTGSHLDSVPNGGRFDGIVGVVGAMEVATLLVESGKRPRHTLRFVVFANEEGARFGQACNGSRMVAGLTVSSDLDHLVDKQGVTLADALRGVGLDPTTVGSARWDPRDWAAFIELHIEQGSVLTQAQLPIGVVDLISGSTRLDIAVTGSASHSGGTPMHLRADALAASAEMIIAGERIARDSRHHGTRITVGRLVVEPGSITTIPGRCELAVDIRDIDSDRQRAVTNELIASATGIAEHRGVRIDVRLLGDASPVILPLSVRRVITDTANRLGLPYRVMPSGASHDSQMINHVTPTGMIFVPSRNHGISHAPEELTTAEDVAVGTDLLAASLLRLDAEDGALVDHAVAS